MREAGHIPIAQTGVSGSFATEQGVIGIGPFPGNRSYYNLVNSWQTATIFLPAETYAGSTQTLVFGWRNDGSGGDGHPAALTDVSITYSIVSTTPANAIFVWPVDNSMREFETSTLRWLPPAEGPEPTGYKVYFGTTNPPPLVGDVGSVTSWTPPAALLQGQRYYWQIVPYNVAGDVVGSPIWTFYTQPNSTITAFPYLEDFDGVIAPFLPTGWRRLVSTVNTNSTWLIDTTTDSTPISSTPNHVRINNGADTGLDGTFILYSPVLENISERRVRFVARTITTGEVLHVGTLSDPNDLDSWQQIATIDLTTINVPYTVSLETAAGRHLAFRHGNGGTSRTLLIDDVFIESRPIGADAEFSANRIDFGLVEQNVPTARSIDITNHGTTALIINHTFLPDEITVNVPSPFTVDAVETETLIYTLTATTAGDYIDTIHLTTNADNAPILTLPVSAFVAFPQPDFSVWVPTEENQGDVLSVPAPWDPWYRYTYSQVIYYGEELAGITAGNEITHIGYNFNGHGATEDRIRMWIGYTTLTAFETISSWVHMNELELVYDGSIYLPELTPVATSPIDGAWVWIQLDTPFTYDGVSNIVVAVHEYQAGDLYTSSHRFFNTSTPGINRGLVYRNDSTDFDYTSHQTGARHAFVPNTRFGYAFVADAQSLVVTPVSIDYGDIILYDPAPVQNVRLRNNGAEPVVINSIVIGGNDASDFEFINLPALPFVITAGTVSNLLIRHTPTTAGNLSATMTITTDIIGSTPTVIPLTSFAIDQSVTISVDAPFVENFDTLSPPAIPATWRSILNEAII
jgi:hypothetical protein